MQVNHTSPLRANTPAATPLVRPSKPSASVVAASARPSPFVSTNSRMRSDSTSRSRQSITPSLLKSERRLRFAFRKSPSFGLDAERFAFKKIARSSSVRNEKSASSHSLKPRMSNTEVRRRFDSTT